MDKKQPTTEQLKKFWEWCGFEDAEDVDGTFYRQRMTDGIHAIDHSCLPVLDLNNLFKYAVPKLYSMPHLNAFQIHGHTLGNFTVLIRIGAKEILTDGEITQALFWAIQEVING